MKLRKFILIVGCLIMCFLNICNNSWAQWVHQKVPNDIGLILTMDFIDSQTGSGGGWILESDFHGRSVYTTNGGSNWLTSQVPDTARSLVSIQFVNSSTGYCAAACNTFFPENRINLSKNYFKDFNLHTGQRQYNKSKKYYSDAGENYKGLFCKTTDAGQTWNTFGDLPDNVYYLKGLHFINENTGFVTAAYNVFGGVDDGVLKTTNGGLSWNALQMPDTINDLRNIYFIDSNTGFAVGYKRYMDTVFNAVIVKTTNGGSSWTIQNFPDASSFYDINFTNPNTGFTTGSYGDYYSPTGSVVFKTTNSGITWLSIPLQLKDIYLQGIRFVPGTGIGVNYGRIRVSSTTYIAYISKTTNYGQSWVYSPVSNPDNIIIIGSKLLDQNNWYLCGYRAVILHTTNGGVSIRPISNIVPSDFQLNQNYPNPFNPVTNLEFGIPKLGFVSLKVYDVLGNEVATLVNENKNPGTYNYQLSSDNYQLSSGIYFYSLLVDGSLVDTKRMILLK